MQKYYAIKRLFYENIEVCDRSSFSNINYNTYSSGYLN